MRNPMVSVVMPVYNGEKYLKDAIESVLDQTYTDFEFIILNDGSTDKTEEIILSYGDPRILYIKNETNLQIVKTLNKGVALAKGKYIIRMDADDISLSERLEKQVEFMEENRDIDVCGTWVETFGVRKKIWKYPLSHEEIKVELLFNSALAHPSIIIKKDFFDHFEYEEKYNKAEDYALWVKSIEEKRFSNLPFPLLKYRLHVEQTDKRVQIDIANQIREMYLKHITHTFNSHERDTFMKFVSNQYAEFTDVESVCNQLLQQNKRSMFLDQPLLERSLASKFLIFMGMHTNRCLHMFYRFQNSSMKKYLSFSPLLYMKLLVKCSIRNFYGN